MERPNSSSNLGNNITERWKYRSNFPIASSDHTTPMEMPWVTRNYTCSFCKRWFKSAQALGGHMNVHRRERARLRLLPLSLQAESCPSLHNLNPNPNPNPNFSLTSSSTSLSTKLSLHHYAPHSLINSRSDQASTAHKEKKSIEFEFDQRNSIRIRSINHGRANMNVTNFNKYKKRAAIEDEDLKRVSLIDGVNGFKPKKSEKSLIRFDLEMGLLKDSDSKDQEVDLELRLGYV